MEDKAKFENVKCPSCAGAMEYDMNRGVITCLYCGHEEKMTFSGSDLRVTEELTGAALFRYHGIAGIPITEEALEEKECDWGQKMVQASCKSCGGEVLFQEGSITAMCPYCGSAVLDISDTNQKPPTAIVLFKYERDGLKKSMSTPIFDNILCPKAFKNAINFNDFTSMYVPLWVIDVGMEVDYRAEYMGQVHEGTHKKVFHGIEVAASNVYKLLMDDQKEKYDIELHADFRPELVAGCVVQKYTVTLKEAYEIAKSKVKGKIERDLQWKLLKHIKAPNEKDIKVTYKDIRYKDSLYRLILVPVYFHSIPFEGKIYPQSVNGQNGAYVGDFPAKFRKHAVYKMYV